ncbi:MAG: amidase [Actinomycetota bacterium]|nr:amidase [Actinomycetota bacterium]
MTSEGNDGKVGGSADALSLDARPNSPAYSPRIALARIEAGDAVIRAFLPEALRRVRVEAACAAAPAGPLHGVLVGVKDVIRVTGLDTRAGSALPPEALAGEQASVIDRVQAAGATVAGKTVTAEFAVAAPGPTRNPRCFDRTPGGSSSGSAAAVAAGMVPLALGTQTIGSVIRPAAYCGVVGFRPTWGVIPLDGVLTNARSLDTVGLFTVDARSAQIAAAVLCQWTPLPPPDRPPVLGVPDDDYLDAADDDARLLFQQHLQRLQSAGYEVRPATLVPDLKALHDNLQIFQRFELAQAHQDWFKTYRHLYRPATAAAIQEGQQVTPAEYEASTRWREQFIASTDAIMNDTGIDVWITPAATGAPPLGLASTGSAVMSAPFSFAGMPAIALPTADHHLPHGVQVAAARHNDRYLLAVATTLETDLRHAPSTWH